MRTAIVLACLLAACPVHAQQRPKQVEPSPKQVEPAPQQGEPAPKQVMDEKLVVVAPDDPAMAQAVTAAQASLPGFLDLAAHPRPSTDKFAVKIGIGPLDAQEFVWIAPFSVKDGVLTGTLANAPERVGGYTEGQTITVPLKEVTDWMYFVGPRMVGNFSACALLTHEPLKATMRFERQYKVDCKAPGTY